jgi:hypothetical protein
MTMMKHRMHVKWKTPDARLNPRLRWLSLSGIGGKVALVRLAHKVVRSGLRPSEALLDWK